MRQKPFKDVDRNTGEAYAGKTGGHRMGSGGTAVDHGLGSGIAHRRPGGALSASLRGAQADFRHHGDGRHACGRESGCTGDAMGKDRDARRQSAGRTCQAWPGRCVLDRARFPGDDDLYGAQDERGRGFSACPASAKPGGIGKGHFDSGIHEAGDGGQSPAGHRPVRGHGEKVSPEDKAAVRPLLPRLDTALEWTDQ